MAPYAVAPATNSEPATSHGTAAGLGVNWVAGTATYSAWLDRRLEKPITSSPTAKPLMPGAKFGHHPCQVAALPGWKRRGEHVAHGPRSNRRLTDIDTGCLHFDQDLADARHRAGHVAHLKYVNVAVRIELHCSCHH